MTAAEVTYIGHSGFLVGLGSHFLLFDLFKDEAGVLSDGLPSGGSGAVFVSHRHSDHFNGEVLSMGKPGKTAYVLDSGIPREESACEIMRVKPYEHIDLGWAKVKTFGSTDEGCSFLVEAAGISIFHSGDLNDWYWEDESTPEELEADEARYLGELSRIAGNRIDIAFVPVDLRLGTNAFRGAMHFARILRPAFLLPMHINGRLDNGILPSMLHREGLRTAVVHMTKPGDKETLEP